MTSKTTLLVADDAAQGTSKWNKAEAMEIPIVSEQFIRLVIAGKASASKPIPIGEELPTAVETTTEASDSPEPGDVASEEAVPDASYSVGGVSPKTFMKKGQEIEVHSTSSTSKYRVKRVGNHYYCTCISWRQQKLSVDCRTCKHLKQVLGDDFELARVGAAGFDIKNARNTNEPKEVPGVMLAHKWEPAKYAVRPALSCADY